MQTLDLSFEQEQAVDLCVDLSEKLVGITGGAGTGKTTIQRIAFERLSTKTSVVLCAPTGRAAKRVQEATGITAKTIHRLLEFPSKDDDDDALTVVGDKPQPWLPKRNASNPLPFQVVLVDEASMVGPELFGFLSAAMPKNGVIRLFGDNNQLPPVEEGTAPFVKVLEERPSIVLSYNYRSGNDILDNANRILEGRLPRRNDCFEMVYTADPIGALRELITPEFGQIDHQIITPRRTGTIGSVSLSRLAQLKIHKERGTDFNLKSLELDRYSDKEPNLRVMENDKVLWIKNDYNFNIFNGETGIIRRLDSEEGSVTLEVDGRIKTIPPSAIGYNAAVGASYRYDPRKNIELGYTITTHKAQGSEVDIVIYLVHQGQYFMLNRRNFYTAVSRAKKFVYVIGQRGAISASLRPYKR